MNLRSLLAVGSLVASMAFPSFAGAQVQIRAGIQVGTPRPRTVVVQPQPQVVVVQQPQPVYVQRPQPVYVQQPQPVVVVAQPQPVYVARRGRWHRGRRGPVVVQTPNGVYVDRHPGRGRGHRRH